MTKRHFPIIYTAFIFFLGVHMTVSAQNATERNLSLANVGDIKIQKCGKTNLKMSYLVKLALSNHSGKPQIVVNDAVSIVGTRMAISKEDLAARRYLHDTMFLPSFKQKNLIGLGSPTNNIAKIVAPGETFSWSKDEWMNLSEKEDSGNSYPHLSMEKLKAVNFLWVEFLVSFFPTGTMESEGKDLRKKWKSRGELLLETITTEPVQIPVDINKVVIESETTADCE